MFQDIDTYMQQSREERRVHLKLEEPCIFIGGVDSREYRGLLAHHLKTVIPTGKRGKVNCCHACGNHHCSNVNHLYWGTGSDNALDAQGHGTVPIKKPKPLRPTRQQIKENVVKKLEILKGMDRSQYGWIQEAHNLTQMSHTHIRRLCVKYGLESYQRQ